MGEGSRVRETWCICTVSTVNYYTFCRINKVFKKIRCNEGNYMKPNSHTIVFERVVYISIIVVLTVFGTVSLLRTINVSVALQEVSRENELLVKERYTLNHELDMARARAADLKKTMPGLSEKALAEFRSRGLADPHEDIIDDLGSRVELMPFKVVFGARPSFYTEVRMYVLNARWAFASFNDGHNIGDSTNSSEKQPIYR